MHPANNERENAVLRRKKELSKTKLKIISLGGLNEIGKNLTCIEYGNDMVIIDCGLGFPEEDMLGIDLVIPDITYLEKNSDRIRGILLTHGHEDHIGALPYVLKTVNVPVYGTGLTIGILENKLLEHELDTAPELITVEAGDRVSLGCFEAEFIHVNHSIADSCCIALRTPVGTIVHSGDFKLDITPAVGEMMDITRLGEIGREGVLLLMCESTNAERPGYSPSERKVGASFGNLLQTYRNNRIIIATFSSNVHRVQQIIDLSAKYNRKVAITGRSMLNVVGAAVRLGYMNVPDGVLIDISEIKKYSPEQLIVVTTGSQGEPMSALYRMTFSGHDKVTLDSNDVVVLSANPIPGNEKLVGKIINELYRRGVTVVNDATAEVHVSGHACREELMLMHALTKPKYFMPIHGEYRHLINHKNLALKMGMPSENIFVSAIGKVLEIDGEGARFNGSVPSGKVLIDGYGVGDVGNVVLRDRRHLAQDGLIAIVVTVDTDELEIVSGPDIISRGFVYVKESEDLMEEIRDLSYESISDCLLSGADDWIQLKTKVKDDVSKFLYSKTKRNPMILPIIMEV
ncbi:MAG: ribonuclease J [Clostridia bacterium]|nr:ribonuclease J [Clostridia bacterium]